MLRRASFCSYDKVYESVNFNSIFVMSNTAIRARPICRNFFKSVFFPNKNIRSILPLLY